MGKPQQKNEKGYKVEAVKLAKEIGTDKAAIEHGVPKGTLSGWLKEENDFLAQASAFFATSRRRSAKNSE